jgi:hypothetical protein
LQVELAVCQLNLQLASATNNLQPAGRTLCCRCVLPSGQTLGGPQQLASAAFSLEVHLTARKFISQLVSQFAACKPTRSLQVSLFAIAKHANSIKHL